MRTISLLSAFPILLSFLLTLAYSPAWADEAPANSCGQLYSAKITNSWINRMRAQIQSDPAAVERLRDATQINGLQAIALNKRVLQEHNNNFSYLLPQTAVPNQFNSGRCWLEGPLNCYRNLNFALGNMGPNEEFSLTHPHFFNMLEKSNKWLTQLISKSNPTMTQAKVRELFNADKSVMDGGTYEWFSFLIAKYGLVTKKAMPETISSMNTAQLLPELKKHLGRVANEIRKQYVKMELKPGDQLSKPQIKSLLKVKDKGMEGIYRILVAHLGDPYKVLKEGLKPGEFEFTLPDGTVKVFDAFSFRDFLGIKTAPNDYVTIAASPFQEMGKVYTVKESGIGIPGPKEPGYDLQFLNVPMNRMKELILNTMYGVKGPDGKFTHFPESVAFAADVRHSVHSESGIMHTEIFKPDSIYALKQKQMFPELNRAEALLMGVSEGNHEMAITGVDIEKNPANPNEIFRKLKVENSWGDKAGLNGNYAMYEKWFDKYVYQATVPRWVLSPDELKALEQPYTALDEADLYNSVHRK